MAADVVYEGSLMKMGKLLKKWTMRRFTLMADGTLLSHAVEPSSPVPPTPKRCAHVSECAIQRLGNANGLFQISLTASKDRVLRLGAKDAEDASMWVAHLAAAKEAHAAPRRAFSQALLRAMAFPAGSRQQCSQICALPARDWDIEWQRCLQDAPGAAKGPATATAATAAAAASERGPPRSLSLDEAVHRLARLSALRREFEAFCAVACRSLVSSCAAGEPPFNLHAEPPPPPPPSSLAPAAPPWFGARHGTPRRLPSYCVGGVCVEVRARRLLQRQRLVATATAFLSPSPVAVADRATAPPPSPRPAPPTPPLDGTRHSCRSTLHWCGRADQAAHSTARFLWLLVASCGRWRAAGVRASSCGTSR
jgi:hypothetical protein